MKNTLNIENKRGYIIYIFVVFEARVCPKGFFCVDTLIDCQFFVFACSLIYMKEEIMFKNINKNRHTLRHSYWAKKKVTQYAE